MTETHRRVVLPFVVLFFRGNSMRKARQACIRTFLAALYTVIATLNSSWAQAEGNELQLSNARKYHYPNQESVLHVLWSCRSRIFRLYNMVLRLFRQNRLRLFSDISRDKTA